MHNRATEDILEAQNREFHDRLSSKASYLKSIALDMEAEAKDHHKLIDDIDMESSRNLMIGTVNRVKQMLSTSGRNNRRVMGYTIIIFISFIMFIYFLLYKLF